MRKALRFSICALLLALAMAVTQIPAKQVVADTKPTESQDSDFQMNGSILVKYTGTAQTVSVPASVTEIAAEAFAGNTQMETLVFKGNKLESIGYRAFADCTGLKEVKIPDTVTELGNGAFSNCTAIKKVTLGTGLSGIGIGAFAGCDSLEKMELAKDNTSLILEDDCLYKKDKTVLYLMLPYREKDTYSMPSSVTDIAEYAFWNCSNVKTISLSSHLEEIPDYAFTNCKSLTGISIPYSVKSIGVKSFADCVNLVNVNIPYTVSAIHGSAFDGCYRLVINTEDGSAADTFYEAWLQNNRFEYEDTGNMEIPDVTPLPEEKPEADTQINNGTEIGRTYVVANSAVIFIEDMDEMVYGQDVSGSDQQASVDDNGIKSWEIPKYKVFEATDGKVLADQAFYKNKDLEEYTIPSDVTEIGEFTFARSNLEEVSIPNGVETIGYGAFYHCDYLRVVKIPSSVTYIAPKAFSETLWIESWMNGEGEDDFLIVGDGILLAYRGNGGYIELPDTVKRIAPEVFAGNRTIYTVHIPDSVIEIGEDAFCGCLNLKTVTGCENVKVIKDRAFYGCELQSAHVSGSVEYLGLGVFDFSETTVSDSSKVVVFDGDTLPEISNELTAERLSNDESRIASLGDTFFVIVDKKVKAKDLAGTVLDVNGSGFEGIVAYVSTLEPKTVACIATTYSQEEWKDLYIPEYIMIDGERYKVEGKESVSLYGNRQEYDAGTLMVVNESHTLSQTAVTASLEGNIGAYEVRVSDASNVRTAMNAAYEAVYRNSLPDNAMFLNVSLTDLSSGVNITRTGNQALRVTVTLPDEKSTLLNNNLRILTLDRNGQITNLSYSREGNTITFATNMPGPVVFCSAGNVPDGRMDASPDTGIRDIHPKYFWALGLASLGIATLFVKRKRVKRK